MSRKSKRISNDEKYDQHIVDALLKLKSPIIGYKGIEFCIRDKARYEDGVHHIAKKTHRLKVKDIETIPEILKHPIAVNKDPHNKNYKNYYGIRKGDDPELLLKIVTWHFKKSLKKEIIITIFPTRTIKIE